MPSIPDHRDGAEAFDFGQAESELRELASWLRDLIARWPLLHHSQTCPSSTEVRQYRRQSVWTRVMVPAGRLIRRAFSRGGFQADGRLRRLVGNWPKGPTRGDVVEMEPIWRGEGYPPSTIKRMTHDPHDPARQPSLDAKGFELVVALRSRVVHRQAPPYSFHGRVDFFPEVLEYLADELDRDPAIVVSAHEKPVSRRMRKQIRKASIVGKARVGRSRRRLVPAFRAEDYLEE
jgi:hypothetical protein